MNDKNETISQHLADCRALLVAGNVTVPIELGLTVCPPHIERGERECFVGALSTLAAHVGAASRVIDCGLFAGHTMAALLDALERPKAGIVMTTSLDQRLFGRLHEKSSTAQITHVAHDASQAGWPLEDMGAGKTLVLIGGGGFGFWSPSQAICALDHASQSISQGDFVALTLEMVRDGASLDAIYAEFGHQLSTFALTALGRHEGFETRSFYDPSTISVRFGAVAVKDASIGWNGTQCRFGVGTRLDMGAMSLHTPKALENLHPDFVVQDRWTSQDHAVTLLLLRKT